MEIERQEKIDTHAHKSKQEPEEAVNTWMLGMGLQAIPESIRKQVGECKPRNEQPDTGCRVVLTRAQLKEIDIIIRRRLKNGYKIAVIYNDLLSKGFLTCKETGGVASMAKISGLAYDIRKELGLARDNTDSARIAYEMKHKGATDEAIAKKLRVMESSIGTLVSRYKRRIELKD